MRNSMLATAALLTLSACGGSDWTENPDQQSYYRTFMNDNSTDSQIQVLKYAKSRPVANWNAVVSDVVEDGQFTIIYARYGYQDYRLFLFENEAREKARTLAKEAHLKFSGDLGPELSATLIGARTNPEFEFYPTSVVSGSVSIKQAAERIAAHESEDRRIVEEERGQREREALESSVEDQVVRHCKTSVLEALTYPASGSFSWTKKQVEKESDSKWIYRDVVTARNALGADLPSRFICTVTIKGDVMNANVRILDGP